MVACDSRSIFTYVNGSSVVTCSRESSIRQLRQVSRLYQRIIGFALTAGTRFMFEAGKMHRKYRVVQLSD